mgnify:CR=1 FL=1
MNDIKLADLNDIQDFFNRVDSASTTEKFNIDHPIGVKDFIRWCNEPCDYYPKSSTSDPAYRLGKTICALNELDSNVLDNLRQILNDTDDSEARFKLLDCDELISRLKNGQKEMKEGMTEELPENVAFFLALKLRLKDCHDEQGYYHYQFDDNANSIARVDPLKPFTDSARENLNQQWHVLISKLAYLDVAHALSNEQHEYHCLYQHIKSWDMGNLGALHLQLLCSPNQPESKRIKLQLVKPETAPKPRTITYPSEAMNAWLKKALRTLAGK